MLYYPKIKGTQEHDPEKMPTMSLKLQNFEKTGWQPEVYDENCEPLFLKKYNKMSQSDSDIPSSPLQFIPSKCRVMCLVQSAGIWNVNGKVTFCWSLKQAMVKNPVAPAVEEGVCFMTPSSSQRESLKNEVSEKTEPSTEGEGESVSCAIEDDSDEEDNTVEVEAEVEVEADDDVNSDEENDTSTPMPVTETVESKTKTKSVKKPTKTKSSKK
jgi:hypothetical protein